MKLDLDRIAFSAEGLVPVVAQDAATGDVLGLEYADRIALQQTMATGKMHYYSRVRGRVALHGDADGEVQEVVSLHVDCDADAVLARVRQTGAACHRGTPTCFTADEVPGAILTQLGQVIARREGTDTSQSYTARLLADGAVRRAALREKCEDLLSGEAGHGRAQVAQAAADVLFHVLVAAWARKVSAAEVLGVLQDRRRG